MAADKITAREAGALFGATMAASMMGIFFGIYMLFVDVDIALRLIAAVLVGIVGILSFLRHSVWYKSDQVRKGWYQEHPEYQLEVGYANLAFGIWGLIIPLMNWGSLACGVIIGTYATYLLCTLFLHAYEAFWGEDLHRPEHRARARHSVISTGAFVVFLYAFAIIALVHAGAIPFLNL